MSYPLVALSDVVLLQRGFDLPHQDRRQGPYPVVSAGGVVAWHDEGPVKGPGVAIGRATNLGVPTWVASDYWPLNTTLFVKDFKGNDPGYVYRLFQSLDLTGFDSGSVQAMLNRNYIAQVPVPRPPLPAQRAIAEVLGALDDKISINSRVADSAERLASVTYAKATRDAGRVASSERLAPLLGGTPDRGRPDFWDGDVPWVSAKDISGAPSGVILETSEGITPEGVAGSRAKPVPEGSVILTARGTVGAVARLGVRAAFNQSCYAFRPTSEMGAACLYFMVRDAAEDALSVSHGSVFSTITMRSFNALTVPDLDALRLADLELVLAPLLQLITARVSESRHLAILRDTLLPHLMSGRLTVREAEQRVEEVL